MLNAYSEHMDEILPGENDARRLAVRQWIAEHPEPSARLLAESGLVAPHWPEPYGLGADPVHQLIIDEELSAARIRRQSNQIGIGWAAPTIIFAGTQEQKDKYLPDLATGKRRTGIGLTEPDAGTDLQGIRTTARLEGEEYVINGSKTWITNARHADPLPVLVKTDPNASPAHKGMSVILIEAGTPGFEIGKDIGKLGYKGTESCEVILTNVRVPKGNLLGGVEGRGMQQVLSGLETGRVNIAARSVGIAQAAYEAAINYSKERKAFGQPISEFQAIQLKLAEIATNLQAARLMTYWAASKADAGERVDMEAGMAKYFASEVAIMASLEAMRVHGGYGYSTEYVVERLYRDAPLMSIGEGTNDIMKMVIAKSLLSGKTQIG